MQEFNPQIVPGPSFVSYPDDLYVDPDGDQIADLVISAADFDAGELIALWKGSNYQVFCVRLGLATSDPDTG